MASKKYILDKMGEDGSWSQISSFTIYDNDCMYLVLEGNRYRISLDKPPKASRHHKRQFFDSPIQPPAKKQKPKKPAKAKRAKQAGPRKPRRKKSSAGLVSPEFRSLWSMRSEMGNKEWYYKVYLKSALWSRIKSDVLARDNGACAGCGSPTQIVHHKNYSKRTLAGDDMDNLVSLCETCHNRVHFCDGEKVDWLVERDRLAEVLSQHKPVNMAV